MVREAADLLLVPADVRPRGTHVPDQPVELRVAGAELIADRLCAHHRPYPLVQCLKAACRNHAGAGQRCLPPLRGAADLNHAWGCNDEAPSSLARCELTRPNGARSHVRPGPGKALASRPGGGRYRLSA